ncbi:M23 family metallopeptidase [Niallia oryzisoli]|uniref:M23 family metallopeptidase n=1 Tax=Niallia oryzisoli TaxID=1737571 RepID=A0ABZ2C5W9_9BACI
MKNHKDKKLKKEPHKKGPHKNRRCNECSQSIPSNNQGQSFQLLSNTIAVSPGIFAVVRSDPKDPFIPCALPQSGCVNVPTPFRTYPGSPLIGPLTVLRGCDSDHLGARDFANSRDITSNETTTFVGQPVFAAESGKINLLISGGQNCTGPNCQPDLVGIRSDFDRYVTQYVHVSPLPTLEPGQHVNEGQQIGTVDLSGDFVGTPTPHVHMARYTPEAKPTCNWTVTLKQFRIPPRLFPFR